MRCVGARFCRSAKGVGVARRDCTHSDVPPADDQPEVPSMKYDDPRSLAMRPCASRRGLALMLVLVSVSVVTVLSLALLSRQQAEASLSDNIEARVNARFAAESGVELAAAIMECDDVDWRTAHIDGVLIDAYDFGGGTITVKVTDEDGDPPTEETESVVMESSASNGRLKSRRKAIVYAPKMTGDVDLDLSEFALLAQDSIAVRSSQVVRASNSPAKASSAPIRLATNSTSAGAITLGALTRIADGVAVVRGSASGAVISRSSDASELRRMSLLANEAIPVPNAPAPVMTGLSAPDQTEWVIGSGTWLVPEPKWFNNITVRWDAILEPDAACDRVLITGNLYIKNGGTFRVTRDLDLIVQGNLWMINDAVLEVVPPARLRLFVGGDILVESTSLIGISRAAADIEFVISDHDAQTYQSPEGCTIYQIPGSPRATWTFTTRSGVCGRIYAPNTDVLLNENAVLLGGIVGNSIEIDSRACVYWDPVFDTANGYTARNSPLIDEAGVLADALHLLTDLSEHAQTVVAAALAADGVLDLDSDDDDNASSRTKVVDFRWLEEEDEDGRRLNESGN